MNLLYNETVSQSLIDQKSVIKSQLQFILFHNHPQRNMKRKFPDFLTLLTLTEKLLTRTGSRTFGNTCLPNLSAVYRSTS